MTENKPTNQPEGREVILKRNCEGQSYPFLKYQSIYNAMEEYAQQFATPPNQLSGIEGCNHEPLTDTGVGYYHCPACGKGWTYDEWKAGYAASDGQSSGIDVLGVVDILNDWVNENGNRETIPRKAFLEIAKKISSNAASEGEEAIGFAEWIVKNDYKTGAANEYWFKWVGFDPLTTPYTTAELYNLYKLSKK